MPSDKPPSDPRPSAFEQMKVLHSYILPSSTQPPAAPIDDPRPDGLYFRGTTDEGGARDVFCQLVDKGKLTEDTSLRTADYAWDADSQGGKAYPDFGPEAPFRSVWALAHALVQLIAPEVNSNDHVDAMEELLRRLPPNWKIEGALLRRFVLSRELYDQVVFAYREGVAVETVTYLAKHEKPLDPADCGVQLTPKGPLP